MILGSIWLIKVCSVLFSILQKLSVTTTDTQGRSPSLAYCPVYYGVNRQPQGLGLWVFAKTNLKQMRPQSLCTMQHFTRVYFHPQPSVDAGDIHTWLTTVKNPKTPSLSPIQSYRDKRFWDLQKVVYLWWQQHFWTWMVKLNCIYNKLVRKPTNYWCAYEPGFFL